MSFTFLPFLRPQWFDNNGDPLSGGKLYSYIAGTSTPSGTFQDADGSTPNTNPIILDSGGRCNVFISVGGGAYKFVLTDADDNIIYTEDDVSVSSAETPSGWADHSVTDGQTASDLTGELINMSLYSSALFDVEISRGTTVLSTGQIAVQNVNGVARVRSGTFMGDAHGVTFSVSGVLASTQLKAALSAGPGNGTIKMSKRLIPA